MIYIGYPDEVWKPLIIDGEVTKYAVSTYGNVKNTKTNKPVGLHEQNSGYYGFTISHKGKTHSYKIARVVAEMFIENDDPEVKTQIDHLNSKRANSIYDLEWVSPQENAMRKIERANNKGQKIITTNKYSKKIIKKVCKLLEKDFSISEISKKLEIPKPTIRDILYGKRHTDISKDYDFTKRSNSHSKSGKKAKYSEEIIRKICKMYLANKKVIEIAKELDIPENTIHGIINGKYVAYRDITKDYDLTRKKPIASRYTSEEKVKDICKMLENDLSINEISKKLQVSEKVITNIKNRVSFIDISKEYNF